MSTLVGEVAVVTGAGSGIGRAIALELASRGCDLALVDLHEDRLAEVRAAVERAGRRATGHAVDVGDEAAMMALAEAVVAAHGKVSILVNNAGVSVAGAFERVTSEDFAWLFRTNFWGVVHGCRAFLPHLRENERAHVLNVVSSFALAGAAGKTAYASSKFAVRGFSESLRCELSGTGVGLTLLYPGPVDTRIVREGRAVSAEQRSAEADFLARRAIRVERVAQKAVDGMLEDRYRVLLSVDYRAIDLVSRLSPALASWLGGVAARRLPF
jgi:NAD(P)-dependent dehydrogenase (short-subunit alcohol dehydrogenase family)